MIRSDYFTKIFLGILVIVLLLTSALIDFRGAYALGNFIMLLFLAITALIAIAFNRIYGLLFSIVIVFVYSGIVFYQGLLGVEWFIPLSYVWLVAFPLISILSGFVGERIRFMYKEMESCTQLKESLVTKDELTGLGNAKEFYQNLKIEMAVARRHEGDLILAMIEIQYFDELMSVYGRDSYTKIFDLVTAVLIKCTRTEDTIYRISEKTFSILMPNTPMAGAKVVKQRIKEEMASINTFEDKSFQEFRIEVRVGLADYDSTLQTEFAFKKKAEREVEYDV